jgi:transcription factor S
MEMEVEFCECGGMMIPQGNNIKCRSCGIIKEKKMEAKIVSQSEKKDVVDLPKTEKQCEQCGNNEAYFWLIQTRSSDEPPTQFFRCTECKFVWREYK